MAELLLTHGYFLYEDPIELQITKLAVLLGILRRCSPSLRINRFPVELQWANQFINLRKPKQESL